MLETAIMVGDEIGFGDVVALANPYLSLSLGLLTRRTLLHRHCQHIAGFEGLGAFGKGDNEELVVALEFRLGAIGSVAEAASLVEEVFHGHAGLEGVFALALHLAVNGHVRLGGFLRRGGVGGIDDLSFDEDGSGTGAGDINDLRLDDEKDEVLGFRQAVGERGVFRAAKSAEDDALAGLQGDGGGGLQAVEDGLLDFVFREHSAWGIPLFFDGLAVVHEALKAGDFRRQG